MRRGGTQIVILSKNFSPVCHSFKEYQRQRKVQKNGGGNRNILSLFTSFHFSIQAKSPQNQGGRQGPLALPPPSGVPEYDNSVAVGDIFAWKFSIFSHMSQMKNIKIMWKFFLKEASILLNQEKYFSSNNNWLQAKYRHEEI